MHVCISLTILLLSLIATEFAVSVQGLEILFFILNNVLLNLHMLLPQLSCTYQYYASGYESTSNETKSKMVKNNKKVSGGIKQKRAGGENSWTWTIVR